MKSLGQLAAEDVGEIAQNLLMLDGVEAIINTRINDAVASAQENNPHVANLLDQSVDDITRAKSVEAMHCLDAARAGVLADSELVRCVGRGDVPKALDILDKKNRIRGGVFDSMSKRKRLEMDDVTSNQRHIEQRTLNLAVEYFEATLTEEGIGEKQTADILQRLADKIAVGFGDDD